MLKESKVAYTATLDRLGERPRRVVTVFTASAADPLALTVAFPAVTTFPAVKYVMSILATSNDVTGSTSPASAVTARGFRLARAGHLPVGVPALTISFPPTVPGNRTSTPGGIGNAKGSITTAGLVPLTGMLGDGQTFTASLNLAQTNQAVVWVTPYTNKASYLGGIIRLAAPGTPDRSLGGTTPPFSLIWARVADAKALSYPAGFSAQELGVISSRWMPTTSWSPHHHHPRNAVPFTGTAVGANGSFTGTLKLPAPAQVSPMSCIFLQDPGTGYTIGQGLIRVPITAPLKGSFQTIGAELQNWGRTAHTQEAETWSSDSYHFGTGSF